MNINTRVICVGQDVAHTVLLLRMVLCSLAGQSLRIGEGGGEARERRLLVLVVTQEVVVSPTIHADSRFIEQGCL